MGRRADEVGGLSSVFPGSEVVALTTPFSQPIHSLTPPMGIHAVLEMIGLAGCLPEGVTPVVALDSIIEHLKGQATLGPKDLLMDEAIVLLTKARDELQKATQREKARHLN